MNLEFPNTDRFLWVVSALVIPGVGLLAIVLAAGPAADYAAAAGVVETPLFLPDMQVVPVIVALAVVVSGMVSLIQPVEEGEDA